MRARNERLLRELVPYVVATPDNLARLDLTKTLGKDPTTWRWGRLHTLTLQNSVLGGEAVPGPIRWAGRSRRRGGQGRSGAGLGCQEALAAHGTNTACNDTAWPRRWRLSAASAASRP